MARLLWLVIAVLVALWVIGLIAKIGGGFIHILLVVAGIIFILQLITGRRSI